MKTLVLLIALVNSNKNQDFSSDVTITGLHFVITVEESELQLHKEVKTVVCDTLNENEFALFKSKDYILACRNHNVYGEKGIHTEVKAFFNDEEISMEDAYSMMNNRNVQEAREYAEKSQERLKEIIRENENIKMHYSITVSMKNDTAALDAYTREYVYSLKESGDQQLLNLGKFVTFTDVKQLYDEMLAAGITNISITASEFGKEIPVSNAVGKEQEYLQQLLAINK